VTISGATRITSAQKGSVREAIADLREAIERHRLWWSLAQEDIRQAYRQSIFGVLWAIFSYVIFAFAILMVFTGGKPTAEFAGYIAVGLLIWNYISGVILESATVFIGAESFIKGIRLPMSLHVMRCVARITVTSLYAMIGAIALLLIFRVPVGPGALAAVPAALFLVFTAIPVQIMLGILCSFSRDFKYVIDNLMRPIFFITPIFWMGPPGTIQATMERLNPFTHYIQIVRAPVIYGVVPYGSWGICIVLTLAFWVIALLALGKFRSQIVFWI